MVTIRRVSCGIVNCYLLSGESGSVLIDAGNPNCGKMILRKLGDIKVSLILLTHGHSDHIGSAADLSEKLHAPIAMNQADVPLITEPCSCKLHGHTALGRILAGASEATMKNASVAPFTPEVLVDEGFELSSYGISAHVIALPGHTAGSIGVLTDAGDVIVGDAAFHMFRPTGARIYEDREAMEASVAKIKRLCTGRIYVGHGGPIKPSVL